jgi:hypothetical protein
LNERKKGKAMDGQLWLFSRMRWLAFVPAIWLSSIVHRGVIQVVGHMPNLTSLNPPPDVVAKAGILWGVSEGITVVAAMVFAVLIGPPRSPLFQVLMITIFYLAGGVFNLTHLDVWDYPALRHAVVVDNLTGMAMSFAILCLGFFMPMKRSNVAQDAGVD